ncbi:hypothetical protein BH23PAT1_BH23PAT1_2810 [soil metagenome]
MKTSSKQDNYTPLIEREVPILAGEQLAKFTEKSIHAEELMDLDPVKSLEKLLSLEGHKVIGADFGGDKGVTRLFTVSQGRLVISDEYEDYIQSSKGDGYLESLERTARFATEHAIPVGISWGAPLDGTKPHYHPKVANFLSGLSEKYSGDFRNLVPTLGACINDGPAGLISGAVEANRSHRATSVLFAINGGGLGIALLAKNKIYSTEAGHIESVVGLNSYDQQTPCGVFGAEYVCIETLGANKAGIEAQWKQITGEYLRAKDIEDRYKNGNELAGELYDHSAWVVAHLIEGSARAFDIDLSSDTTLIVGHGGAFKFPYYGERIQQILNKAKNAPVKLVMVKDYGDKNYNACVDGAALAALVG